MSGCALARHACTSKEHGQAISWRLLSVSLFSEWHLSRTYSAVLSLFGWSEEPHGGAQHAGTCSGDSSP